MPVDVYRSMSYGLPAPSRGGYIVRPLRLATFTMTGRELISALEVALAGPPDLFPQVSGMRFGIEVHDPQILDESASQAVQALIERRRVIDAATSGRIRDLADRGPGMK